MQKDRAQSEAPAAGAAVSDECAAPRVYLMGQNALDRDAYACLLERMNLSVSVQSDFTPTAVWDCLRKQPDLILIDADVPHATVVDAVQMIPRLRPEARLLVVSAAVDPNVIRGWAACTLHGYVVKGGGVAELQAAIAALIERREYFSSGIRRALESIPHGATIASLSRREAELLPLIARGLTLRDAAREMSIAYKTAESYRTSLLRKLGVRDRVELARLAIREKIIDA